MRPRSNDLLGPWLLATALGVALAAPARAAGINLSWNDCGRSGSTHAYFGCETNDGPPYVLIGSFVERNFVVWQSGELNPGKAGGCYPGPPVAARTRTWGTLKSLYR